MWNADRAGGPVSVGLVSAPEEGLAEFAGDLLLRLAVSGALVLERGHADTLIADLTEALAVVRRWRHANTCPRNRLAELGEVEEQLGFDAAFAEQVAPGRLDRALAELPKYIEAFTIAGNAAG